MNFPSNLAFFFTASLMIGQPQLVAANLVTNGGLTHPDSVTAPTPPITVPDRRIPGWVMAGEWYVDATAKKTPSDGLRALRADGSRDRGQQLSQQIYLEPGKRYTLSAWVRYEGLTSIKGKASDQQAGVLLTNWDWTETFRLPLPKESGSDWSRQQLTFTAPAEVRVAGHRQPCLLRVYAPKGERGTLWITGVQLEEGDAPTAFQPVSLPEIDAERQRLEQLKTRIDEGSAVLAAEFQGSADVEKALSEASSDLAKELKSLAKLKSPSAAEWRARLAQFDQLERKARAVIPPLVGWELPWHDLDKRALPAGVLKGDRTLRVTLAQNDYGAAVLAFANLRKQSLAAEISVGGPIAPFSTLSAMSGPVKVSSILYVSNEGTKSQIRLMQGEQRAFPYHLNALGNANAFLIAGGETTQLWFDFSSKGLAPGEHRIPVRIVGLEEAYEWQGEVILEVLPLELPDKVPGNVIAYAGQPFFSEPFAPLKGDSRLLHFTPEERQQLAQRWLTAWEELGFNRVMLTSQMVKPEFTSEGDLAQTLDFSALEAYKQLFDTIGADYWGGYSIARYNLPQEVSPAAEKKVRSYLSGFLEGARKLGLSPENYPLNMYDEPHGKQLEVTAQATRVLRELAPEWRTISTASGSTRARMEPLIPWVDIFVVRQRMGEMDLDPKAIRYLQSKGKEVWGYACSGTWEYTHPYRYYRLLAWQSWKNNLKGYGIYMTMNPESFEQLGPRAAMYSPLFYGKDGPVYSKAARALQLAGRDWSLFTRVREVAEQAEGADLAAEAAALRKLLDESVQGVLAQEEDTAHADTARIELMQQTLHLIEQMKEKAEE